MNVTQKLAALRRAMKDHGVAAYVQPVHDEFMNEYPPASAQRVEWLCGFSGSAGTLAVTAKKAALFVDGRYTLQAEAQVDGALFERHNSAEMSPEAWLAQQLRGGQQAGYDPMLFTPAMLARFEKHGVVAAPVENLTDEIWKERPPAPATPLFIHALEYSGEESAAKRRRVAEQIKKAGADAAVIAAPDSLCWLLNVRARDVECAPLALATVILYSDAKAELFIAPGRCGKEVRAHLGKAVTIRDPKELKKTLAGLRKKRVLCDGQATPVWFMQQLKKTAVEGPDPCLLPKARKNAVELAGMKSAHRRDGVAVAKLLCWLDGETGKRKVMESEVCEKLLSLRAADRMFVEPSFNTISGSGPHGAIVHYRVTPKSDRALQKGELFLLDSGGQYPDGTTDITRTVAVGKPSAEQRDRFTRVLKGHIAVAAARFPKGTKGSQLDALARQHLWQAGLDYDHGTGHGVGCFLNVHEGPQRISKRGGDAALMPGMIVSNEPGYYKAGEYGIRIENLVAVTEDERGLGFETITCAPIDARLVDAFMLTQEEKKWLNDYHAWVLDQLSGGMDEAERKWLKAACAAV